MKKNGKSIKISIESLSKRELENGLSFDAISDLTCNFSNFNLDITESFKKSVITFSKNVFLPITTFCKNNCTYCNFKNEDEHAKHAFLDIDNISSIMDQAKSTKTKEVLITCGQSPHVYSYIKKRLSELNFSKIEEYIEFIAKYIYEKYGIFSHINCGICDFDDLKRLKGCSLSVGLMLETTSKKLMKTVHKSSEDKNPKKRIEFLENAGKLKIPTTTGILIGIGETWHDRIKSLFALKELNERYANIQECILQNYVNGGNSNVSINELKSIVILSNLIMPKVHIQIPPNITKDYMDFLDLGISDFGGISDVSDDYINPDYKWPGIDELKTNLGQKNIILKERLAVYPEFIRKDFINPTYFQRVKDITDDAGYVRSEFSCI